MLTFSSHIHNVVRSLQEVFEMLQGVEETLIMRNTTQNRKSKNVEHLLGSADENEREVREKRERREKGDKRQFADCSLIPNKVRSGAMSHKNPFERERLAITGFIVCT